MGLDPLLVRLLRAPWGSLLDLALGDDVLPGETLGGLVHRLPLRAEFLAVFSGGPLLAVSLPVSDGVGSTLLPDELVDSLSSTNVLNKEKSLFDMEGFKNFSLNILGGVLEDGRFPILDNDELVTLGGHYRLSGLLAGGGTLECLDQTGLLQGQLVRQAG